MPALFRFVSGLLPFGLLLACHHYSDFETMSNAVIDHTVPTLSVHEVAHLLTQNHPLLIDARTAKEYEVSHLKGAICAGYEAFHPFWFKKLPKDHPIIVYCSVGYRSEKIGAQLIREGFDKVYNLKGGIFDWVNHGYPVYKKNEEPTSEVHAFNSKWGKWLVKGEKIYP